MSDDNIQEVTWRDATDYTLRLQDVYQRFIAAGVPRSLRTLQRSCENGLLDAVKYQTETGAEWMVNADSVAVRIAEIKKVEDVKSRYVAPTDTDKHRHDAARHGVAQPDHKDLSDACDAATAHDTPLHDASRRATAEPETPDEIKDRQATTQDDRHRHDDSHRDAASHDRLLEALTRQLDAKDEQIAAKDRQLEARDTEIKHLHEDRRQDRHFLMSLLQQIHDAPDFEALKAARPAGDPINATEERPIGEPSTGRAGEGDNPPGALVDDGV